MRWIKNIFFSLLVSVLLIATVAIFYISSQKDVSKYIVNELNKSLKTQIHIQNIELNIIQSFPDISIELNNVWSESLHTNDSKFVPDTLFRFDHAYIHFGWLKFLKKEYDVKKLILTDGVLNMIIDEKGRNNYEFWKTNTENQSSNFKISLENITFQDIQYAYENIPNGFSLKMLLEKSSFSGHFGSDKTVILVDGFTVIEHIQDGQQKYVTHENAHIKTTLNVNDGVLTLQDGKVLVNNNTYMVDGVIKPKESSIDLSMKANQVTLSNEESLLENFEIGQLKYRTKANLEADLKGAYNKDNGLTFRLMYDLTAGSFSFKDIGPIDLRRIQGYYKKTEQSRLVVDSVYLGLEDSYLSGGGEFLLSEQKPKVDVKLFADVSASDLNTLKFEDLIFKSGILKFSGIFKGYLPDSLTLNLANEFLKKGELLAHDFTFSMQHNPTDSILITSKISLDKDINIRYLKSIIGRSDLSFEGVLQNRGALLDSTIVLASKQFKCYSKRLDLNQVLSFIPSSKDPNKQGVTYSRFNIESLVGVDHLIYKDLSIHDLEGSLMSTPALHSFIIYDGKTIAGSVHGNAAVRPLQQGGYRLFLFAEFQKLDITQLFQSFHNFGQDYITDLHIKGKATGNVKLKTDFNDQFDLLPKTMVANANVELGKGELIEHESIYSMSKFVKLDELKHIYFSKMENQILIQNEEILIPRMEINSTAMDLSIQGKHGFDQSFDYNFQIYLTDLIANKAFKRNEKNRAFAFEDQNRSKHFKMGINLTGNAEDYKIKYLKKKYNSAFEASISSINSDINTSLNVPLSKYLETDLSQYQDKKVDEKMESLQKDGKIEIENEDQQLRFIWED